MYIQYIYIYTHIHIRRISNYKSYPTNYPSNVLSSLPGKQIEPFESRPHPTDDGQESPIQTYLPYYTPL